MADKKEPRRQPISYAVRQFVKERDKYRCKDCGTHLNLQIDHIVPVAMGGTNDISNLVTRCGSCNSSKGTGPEPTKPMPDFVSPRADRLSMAADRALDPTTLVGSFFHSGHERGWQGVIVAEVAPQVYLVETFEWLIGSSYDQELVTLEVMQAERWRFYDDVEWMRNSYEAGVAHAWEEARSRERST